MAAFSNRTDPAFSCTIRITLLLDRILCKIYKTKYPKTEIEVFVSFKDAYIRAYIEQIKLQNRLCQEEIFCSIFLETQMFCI